jgi:hypothetical protein
MYRAERVKFMVYFVAGMYVVGVGLLVASGVAKILE